MKPDGTTPGFRHGSQPVTLPRNPFAARWPLDPAVSYLNHGSFGACPRAVLEKQAALRAELESALVVVAAVPFPIAGESEASPFPARFRPRPPALLPNASPTKSS